MGNWCDYKFEGEIKKGNKLKIVGANRPTIVTYTKGTNLTPENIGDNSQYLEITESDAFCYEVDDIDKAQKIEGYLETQFDEAKNALAEKSEKFVGTMAKGALTSMKSSSTAISSSNALDLLDAAHIALYNNNVTAKTPLAADLNAKHIVTLKRELAKLFTDNVEYVKNGAVGKYGNTFLRLATCLYNDGTDDWEMIRTKKAIAFAGQIDKIKRSDNPYGFGATYEPYYYPEGKECKPYPNNCTIIDLLTKNCTECEELFYLSGNECKLKPEHCETVDNITGICSKCKRAYYLDDDKGHYTDNTYSEEQWAVMEAAGAVFLPAAGYRDGTDVSNVILYGDYWSSTPDASDEPFSENRAYSFSFDSDGLYPQAYGDRFYGLSVRLVQAVPKPVQTKEMTPGIAHLSWDETNNLWSITVYDDNPDFAFVVTVSGEKGTLPTAVTISNSTEDANVFSYVKDPESFGGIIKDANLTITYDGNGIQNDGTDYYTNAKISGQMNDEFGNTLIVNEPADFINIFLPADITEGIESIQSSAVNKQKILRDGQLFIIRDGKTFSAQGIELRSDNQYK